MLSRWVGQGGWIWASLVVALALVSLVEIVAPADAKLDRPVVHAGWLLGLMAALLVPVTSAAMGLRIKSGASPHVNRWFGLTVLSWLLVMLGHGWAMAAPSEPMPACLIPASHQLTMLATAQFLLWSSPSDTRRLRGFAWGQGVLALALVLLACGLGGWNQQVFQVWRILNVVAGTFMLLWLGRALMLNGEVRSWPTLGGSLMAYGLLLATMSAGDHGVSEAWPVHYMFVAYLLMLWLLVSPRIPVRSGVSATGGGPFESSFFAGEAPAPPAPAAVAEVDGQAQTNRRGSDPSVRSLRTRRRIARNLHEGVGSQIVSIISSLDLSDAQQRAVASALEHCLLDVKFLVHDIEDVHENVLDGLGHLRHRVQHLLDGQGIALMWEVDSEGPLAKLSGERSRQTLHVAQEALANVMRHSRATRVTVRCRVPQPGSTIVLEIHDDGAGFEVPQPGQPSGKGLSGMRHRAGSLGGSLDVLSEPGCGTLVRMTMPL